MILVNKSAIGQALGQSAESNGPPLGVEIMDASDRGRRLHSTVARKRGRAVKTDVGKAVSPGELAYCIPNAGGGFDIGIVRDRRKGIRFPLEMDLTFRVGTQTLGIPGKTVNISSSGILIRTALFPVLGSKVNLALAWPE